MPAEPSASEPLLPSIAHPPTNGSKLKASVGSAPVAETHAERHRRYKAFYRICQGQVKEFLSSRAQHYTVLALVSFDLLGIFADIIINLYQCDEKDTGPIWDDIRDALGTAGLVFSCLFLLELLLSVWAFGWRYFSSYFHTFDAIIILAGFIIDVLLHGVLEEVASLVVILRLWRFFKIIEEFSVGAEEQMDGLELRIEQLESENADLRFELKRQKGTLDEEEDGAFGFGTGTGTGTGTAKKGSSSSAGLWQG